MYARLAYCEPRHQVRNSSNERREVVTVYRCFARESAGPTRKPSRDLNRGKIPRRRTFRGSPCVRESPRDTIREPTREPNCASPREETRGSPRTIVTEGSNGTPSRVPAGNLPEVLAAGTTIATRSHGTQYWCSKGSTAWEDNFGDLQVFSHDISRASLGTRMAHGMSRYLVGPRAT